ncbi:GNAT family N-acetyltransferase [Vibrio cholerae]|uniref:GNAT family N-acetyltransferase n=1 Tax=Vibrio cholerae TaxID=666 RepID=UPI001E1AE3CD|nr:GNAT family N-acetyltransferase [Vibrio cholerae]EGQ9631793.1 GNAT family N-acetyltransferase [Vibrio cholerae]EGQ9639087.1 GNAT family N-acetyltransferase [Vibrio cholerae]EGR0726695.1 GNAT family N-acetyltransferase [Vibrio cholerae]EGR1140647.1 GNAT family N-acetyltransferase [Vibrio cholerae]EGR2515304.1 GNAT family N-acetyltransferase [Vibrio cholerae]
MTNKEKYRRLCEQESTIPIFSQAWWLDAVAGDNWDVCIVEKGDKIQATMPYVVQKKFGLTLLIQPKLTQTLGPWLRSSTAKYSKQLSQQKDLMEALIDQLPKYHYFSQNWHYSNTNWLPFYWKGFEQTTRYTYVIEKTSDLERVFSDFEHSKRKNMKKSESIIKVVFDISAEEFYENHKMTLKKQGLEISYSFKLFKRIYDEGYKRNQAKTIAAFDHDGNLHAALFVIWDGISAYDLISTIDPDYRTYGAASVLIRDIIRYTSQFVNKFDFEGSMIEPVERSFRQFGAKQIPYFALTHRPSCWLNTVLHLKKALKGQA